MDLGDFGRLHLPVLCLSVRRFQGSGEDFWTNVLGIIELTFQEIWLLTRNKTLCLCFLHQFTAERHGRSADIQGHEEPGVPTKPRDLGLGPMFHIAELFHLAQARDNDTSLLLGCWHRGFEALQRTLELTNFITGGFICNLLSLPRMIWRLGEPTGSTGPTGPTIVPHSNRCVHHHNATQHEHLWHCLNFVTRNECRSFQRNDRWGAVLLFAEVWATKMKAAMPTHQNVEDMGSNMIWKGRHVTPSLTMHWNIKSWKCWEATAQSTPTTWHALQASTSADPSWPSNTWNSVEEIGRVVSLGCRSCHTNDLNAYVKDLDWPTENIQTW